jgi:hypothetical protein
MQKFLDSTAAPLDAPVVGKGGLMTPLWRSWFEWMPVTLQAIPSLLSVIDIHDQMAAISETPWQNGRVLYGLYRLSFTHRIDQPASASSATQVTIKWTAEGQEQTYTGTNLIGNALTTRDERTFPIHLDTDTDITYAVTYSSTGGTPMTYEVGLVLEFMRPRGNY